MQRISLFWFFRLISPILSPHLMPIRTILPYYLHILLNPIFFNLNNSTRRYFLIFKQRTSLNHLLFILHTLTCQGVLIKRVPNLVSIYYWLIWVLNVLEIHKLRLFFLYLHTLILHLYHFLPRGLTCLALKTAYIPLFDHIGIRDHLLLVERENGDYVLILVVRTAVVFLIYYLGLNLLYFSSNPYVTLIFHVCGR
jgi:hypothetical protein